MSPPPAIKPPGPFDTKLSPADELAFAAWKAKNAPNDSGEDYDLRGFFKSGQGTDERGHSSDLFKKPNHPTFSTQSQYHGIGGNVGGEWIDHGGKSFYLPSATNLKHQSLEDLQDYFTKYEPNSFLLPPAPAAPIPAALSNRVVAPAVSYPMPGNRVKGPTQ